MTTRFIGTSFYPSDLFIEKATGWEVFCPGLPNLPIGTFPNFVLPLSNGDLFTVYANNVNEVYAGRLDHSTLIWTFSDLGPLSYSTGVGYFNHAAESSSGNIFLVSAVIDDAKVFQWDGANLTVFSTPTLPAPPWCFSNMPGSGIYRMLWAASDSDLWMATTDSVHWGGYYFGGCVVHYTGGSWVNETLAIRTLIGLTDPNSQMQCFGIKGTSATSVYVGVCGAWNGVVRWNGTGWAVVGDPSILANLNGGIQGHGFNVVDDTHIYVAGYDNLANHGALWSYNGSVWAESLTCPGMYAGQDQFFNLAVSPSGTEIVLQGGDYGQLSKSADSGATWTTIPSPAASFGQVIALDWNPPEEPCTPGMLAASINGKKLYRCNESGVWEEFPTQPPGLATALTGCTMVMGLLNGNVLTSYKADDGNIKLATFNGASWSVFDCGVLPNPFGPGVQVPSGNVYLTLYYGANSALYRFTGSALDVVADLTELRFFLPSYSQYPCATSDNDIWFPGYDNYINWNALLYHFDGNTWTDVTNDISTAVGLPPGNFWWNIAQPWAAGPNSVYVLVGQTDSFGFVAHWDGNTWTRLGGTDAFHMDEVPIAITGTSDTDIWVASGGGRNGLVPTLYHWDGAAWTRTSTGFYELPNAYTFPLWSTDSPEVLIGGIRNRADGPFIGKLSHKTAAVAWADAVWPDTNAIDAFGFGSSSPPPPTPIIITGGDTVQATGSALVGMGFGRGAADAVQAADGVGLKFGFVRVLADIVQATDGKVLCVGYEREAGDTVEAIDGEVEGEGYHRGEVEVAHAQDRAQLSVLTRISGSAVLNVRTRQITVVIGTSGPRGFEPMSSGNSLVVELVQADQVLETLTLDPFLCKKSNTWELTFATLAPQTFFVRVRITGAWKTGAISLPVVYQQEGVPYVQTAARRTR